jgi:hypothetical protein
MKTLCVPLSVDAMKRLEFDTCIEGDLVELKLDQDEFDVIWMSGLFSELNSELDIMIDVYEDEQISYDKIDIALGVWRRFVNGNRYQEVTALKMIGDLMELAKEKRTGIFFYF